MKTRREMAAGGCPPPSGKIPASPLLTTRALKSVTGKVRDPPSPAAETHACCGRPSFKSQLRELPGFPPPFYVFKSWSALGNARSHFLRNY